MRPSRRANFRLAPQGQAILEESAKIQKQITRLEGALAHEQTRLQEIQAKPGIDDENALKVASQQEKIKSIQKGIEKSEEKLLQLEKELTKGMTLAQTQTDSLNAVVLDTEKQVAVKTQSGIDETIVRRTCDALGLSDTITSSKVAVFHGKIKSLTGAELSHPKVVVQPLASNVRLVQEFNLKQFNTHVVPLLNQTDTEKKMVAQLMLEATDLHKKNAFVQFHPNSDFEKLAASTWQYNNPTVDSWTTVTLKELAWKIATGEVAPHFYLRKEGDVSDGVELQEHAEVQKALKGSFQLVFFDNERVLGKDSTVQTGNPNAFVLHVGKPCLPIRCFFSGTELAMKPFSSETATLVEELQTKKTQVKQAHGSENWILYNALSDELKAEFEKLFFSEGFKFDRNEANFFKQIPQALREKAVKEIREKKLISISDITSESLQGAAKLYADLSELAAEIDPLLGRGYSIKGLIAALQKATDPKSPDFNVFTYLDDCLDLLSASLSRVSQDDLVRIVKIQQKLVEAVTPMRAFARTLTARINEKINKLLAGLSPRVDPVHTKALLERIDKGEEYVVTLRQKETRWQGIKKMLPKIDSANWLPAHAVSLNTEIDRIEGFLQSFNPLPKGQMLLRQERVNQLKAQLTQEAGTGRMTAGTKMRFDEYLQEMDALVRPTIHGLTNALYPHYNFIVELLQGIYEKSGVLQADLKIPAADYRENFLFTGNYIKLPQQALYDGHPITTSCETIIREALHRGVVL